MFVVVFWIACLFGDLRWIFLWFSLVGCLLGFASGWVLWCAAVARVWCFVWCGAGFGFVYGLGLLSVVGLGCVGLFLGGLGGLVCFSVLVAFEVVWMVFGWLWLMFCLGYAL